MAHFAKVEDGIVTDVIVAEQDFIDTLPESETWIQTSYNTRGGVHYDPETNQPDGGVALRYNYASVGFNYDADADAFYPPQEFTGWVLNTSTYMWEPPHYPNGQTDSFGYYWDNDSEDWVAYPDLSGE